MTAQPTPATLPWLDFLDADHLHASFDPTTLDRGRSYHRQGRVRQVMAGRGGTLVMARVRGSGPQLYTTTVRLEWPDDPAAIAETGGIEWSSSCTCPVSADCKHVVATVLAARETLLERPHARGGGRAPNGRRPTGAPARPSAWEGLLRPVVEPRDSVGTSQGTPLALLFQVGPAKPHQGRPDAPKLTIRPAAAGANGGWVRSGIGWNDLDYGLRARGSNPAQLRAVRAFQSLDRSRPQRSYYSYSSSQTMDVAALGPSFWRLLEDAQAAGVTLVAGDRGAVPVRLAPRPVRVLLDLAQSAGNDLDLRATVPLPGVDAPVALVGSPPHGAFAHSDGSLVLARLAAPLSEAMTELVLRTPEVRVPAADVERFLTHYYPLLREHAEVRSSDGTVELPDIPPPRLALAVSFHPDHRTTLHWTFRYRVGEQAVDVALLDAPAAASLAGVSPGASGAGPVRPAVARDAQAEEALLAGVAGLAVLGTVAGLLVPRPGLERPAVVVEPELTGMDTVRFVRDVLPVLETRADIDVTTTGTRLDYVESLERPLVSVATYDPDPEPDAEPAGDGLEVSSGETAADGRQLDWFDLGVAVTVGGHEVPLTHLLSALAVGQEELILDNGTWFSLDVPELTALRRILEEARALQDREPDQLRINRYQAGLWEELVALGVVSHQSERWQRSVGALLSLESLPRPDQPTGLDAELRTYQLDGYQWLSLLWDHRLGGILADDMGLGKTLQTLAMAERAREEGSLTPEAPLLVVAPTSVVATWAREAARFAPKLDVVTVTETERRSHTPVAESTAGAHIVVTSYAIFRIDEDGFRARRWGGLVLDEAQFVKNYRARTYAAVRRLPAPFKLAITGTPLENSLMDLWALLSIVAPGLFPTPEKFGELFRRPIESGSSPELLDTLRRRIRPLLLRRTKEAVAPDLPPKIEQVVPVSLSPQHRRIYDRHLQRERQRILGLLDDVDRNRIAILRALTKLRQLSLDVHLVEPDASAKIPSSKVEALLEQLVSVLGEGHRCLVFSQFTSFLKIVRERLAAEGIEHVYLDGRTRDRPKRIAAFVDGQAPVFVISLKAGGSGLTLTEADYVFVLDPWWNPAVEAQAVDRAHRIGQDKTVMVYRLVSENTIEEKVLELQERKRELFARVVDEGGVMAAPLSAEDIRGLLGA
ncbi:DEAD/DEAH box helicase [Intrasporangium sp.]|uniref:DEAD/DEAH box helicase n=1 Tax=Intrasporangium sp. TaxID=1925024 RepID=UPI00322162D2